ncbi:MAG: PDZ domain-containing protein [Deltaproteobacteria bacterium]|nr:PDZ domain-containing protein [Deltaproteobacteria bacterium]
MRTVSHVLVGSIVALLFAMAPGCAYPRKTASLSTVPPAEAANVSAPGSLTRLRFVSAEIPPEARGARPWDEDGSVADPFIRVYRGDELIFESEPLSNQLRPTFDVVTENLLLPRTEDLKIELWDDDPGVPQPIGIWNGRGLPATALPGADSRLNLEGGAQLLFRLEPADVLRGTGIEEYEVRGDSFLVLSMIELSPAGRAGVRVGDRVTKIDGKTIDELGSDAAAGALSMASSRRSSLTVVHSDGREETVELDGGYTWRSR